MEEMESVSQTLQDATQVARMKINFDIPSSMFESELSSYLRFVYIGEGHLLQSSILHYALQISFLKPLAPIYGLVNHEISHFTFNPIKLKLMPSRSQLIRQKEICDDS